MLAHIAKKEKGWTQLKVLLRLDFSSLGSAASQA